METNIIYNESCETGIEKRLPEKSVNCCVTSPPYYGLRDYNTGNWIGGNTDCDHVKTQSLKRNNSGGLSNKPLDRGENEYSSSSVIQFRDVCEKCGATRIDEQIGLEETPEEYISRLVNVFREVKRVLRDDGTLWVNIGDSYAGYHGNKKKNYEDAPSNKNGYFENQRKSLVDHNGIKNKDLIGIPWLLAFALRNDGWYLRCDIIWQKNNPMPESVNDRPTRCHEYIFLLSKSPKYYYDAEAIKEPAVGTTKGNAASFKRKNSKRGESICPNSPSPTHRPDREEVCYDGEDRNKRSVWTVATKSFKEAHFATFPEKLIIDCIKAGCPEENITCNSCGFNIPLYSNTNANETIIENLSRMQQAISVNRQMEQGKNILLEGVQPIMDNTEQVDHKRMDNNLEGLQDDFSQGSPNGDEIRLCDGTQISDGTTLGEIPEKNGNSPSSKWKQSRQSDRKSSIIGEKDTRPSTKTSNKADILSPLWNENKDFGACPKCGKGLMIGRRGVVLDVFMGAGTTALVSRKLGRNYVGFELNPEYIKIANNRLSSELGIFE